MDAGCSAREVGGASFRAFSLLLLLVGMRALDELCRGVVGTDPVFRGTWVSAHIGNVAIYPITLSEIPFLSRSI